MFNRKNKKYEDLDFDNQNLTEKQISCLIFESNLVVAVKLFVGVLGAIFGVLLIYNKTTSDMIFKYSNFEITNAWPGVIVILLSFILLINVKSNIKIKNNIKK